MKEDFLIKISGTQQQDGEENNISLTTKGSFVEKNGTFFISYNESEATGFKDCVTTVKVAQSGNKVSMLRFGPKPSQLIIERGQRHVCHYDTGYGAVSLGICADEIHSSLKDNGGEVEFSYLLDMHQNTVSRNIVSISVKPSNQQQGDLKA